ATSSTCACSFLATGASGPARAAAGPASSRRLSPSRSGARPSPTGTARRWKTSTRSWQASPSRRGKRRWGARGPRSSPPHPLSFLQRVGLGYLALGRQTRTLSGGEAQRINLANQLGAQLVGTLYVLDEPSIGLHARDTERLAELCRELAGVGNTVVIVEHDRS